METATYDIVVLSSSPPDRQDAIVRELSPVSPFARRVATQAMSSPPLSPLPRPSSPSIGALKSGSLAVSAPDGVARGFATARSLLADIDVNQAFANTERAQEGVRHAVCHAKDECRAKKPREKLMKEFDAEDGAERSEPIPKLKVKPRQRARKTTDKAKMQQDASRIKPPLTTSSHFGKARSDSSVPSVVNPTAPPPEKKAAKPRKPRTKKPSGDENEISAPAMKKKRTAKPRAPAKSGRGMQETAVVMSAHFPLPSAEDSLIRAQRQDTENGKAQNMQPIDEAIWAVPPSSSGGTVAPQKQNPRSSENHEPLYLDEAVSRRRSWTPPLDTGAQQILASLAGKENSSVVHSAEQSGFTNLLPRFAYANADAGPKTQASKPMPPEVVKAAKKRRVEPVELPNNHATFRQSSPEKGKAPKKKARTITDLVTGQYTFKNPEPDPGAIARDFFAPRSPKASIKVSLNDAPATVTRSPKQPSRKRSTANTTAGNVQKRGKSKKTSAKTAAKAQLVQDELLSPTSAVLKIDRQDILFGTSSQLALDESPTTVREIQKAIHESELDAELIQQQILSKTRSKVSWPRLQKIEGKGALWAASSRDEDGELLEKQKSVYMPEPDRTQDIPLLMNSARYELDDSFHDINDFPVPASVPSPILAPQPAQSAASPSTPATTVIGHANDSINEALAGGSSFLDIDDFPQEPPPSNQDAVSSFLDIEDFVPTRPPSIGIGPGAISTGSPKKRGTRSPVTRFSYAQPGQAPVYNHKPNARTESSMTVVSSPSTPEKFKPRFYNIEEILDSEEECLSPSPPRIVRLNESPPLRLISTASLNNDTLRPIYRVPTSYLEFAGLKPQLFPLITSLVRSLPPTTDPTQPSWHEKILLYDAIFVEDFTRFLNQHDGINMWRRATQKQVKAWNKEMKETGKAPVTLDTDDSEGSADYVLAVKKEVEGWVVQKWCEEMSICCINRESKGRSGARKGLY